jgi:hypothetical protein
MINGPTRTEKEYRMLDSDSSSSLKEFSLDRRKYRKKYIDRERIEDEEDSKASITGRLVETLLLEKEEFDNRFYLSSVESAPTGNMLLFTQALYKHTESSLDNEGNITKDFKDICQDAYKDSGYKWSLEKVLEKFEGSNAEIFYKELRNVKSKNLTVVTADDVNNAERVVDELKSYEVTSRIFNLVNSDRYTILKQYQIDKYEIDGLEMKSMMDIIIVDHVKRSIQVYDLKCVWSVEGFFRDYYLYRRSYIQAYVYHEAIKELRERLDLEYYTIEYPKFIVCDSIGYMKPLIYTLDSDDIQDAYLGFTFEGKAYPGVKTIIEDLRWAKENNEWRISRENYLRQGIVNIKA